MNGKLHRVQFALDFHFDSYRSNFQSTNHFLFHFKRMICDLTRSKIISKKSLPILHHIVQPCSVNSNRIFGVTLTLFLDAFNSCGWFNHICVLNKKKSMTSTSLSLLFGIEHFVKHPHRFTNKINTQNKHKHTIIGILHVFGYMFLLLYFV